MRVGGLTQGGSSVERESLFQVLAYLVGGFGIGEDGGIRRLDEHRLAVVVAALQYAFDGHRDLRMAQQRAGTLARPRRNQSQNGLNAETQRGGTQRQRTLCEPLRISASLR